MRNSNAAVQAPRVSAKEILADAFQQFTEASSKLEARYEALKRETEWLREELRKKEAAVKRAEKLATLGETAAAIAHEVRNPLGAIKLFASLLRDECASQPSALELVRHIDTSVNAIEHVVHNILAFSKERSTEYAPVNVALLLQEQVARIEGARGGVAATVAVRVEVRGDPYIRGNEHGLRQVLQNLTQNAVQAMKGKGELSFLLVGESPDNVSLTVKDSGPGIKEADSDRIFEPFYTTRNEGTGLGLAIVRRIIEEHGGSISVRNNGGAEFTILLPRKGAAA